MVRRVLLSLLAGFVAAMLVWFAGMFVVGDYYWFMQTGGYAENATLTRMEMMLFALMATFLTFLTTKDR